MAEAVFSADEFALGTGGTWQGDLSAFPARAGFFSDTRIDGTGKVFFAFSGVSFDAHDFLDAAAAAGCCALCIRKNYTGKTPDLPLLRVDDVFTAFQKLAAFHRNQFSNLTVAGITGSVGKTSTKEMVRAIFTEFAGTPDAVLYTIGNTNNHIGVPQNLLRLTEQHRFAVIEMGTSSPGEILPLSLLSRPDAAAVNTVAACHLENLGSLDGVAREKSDVFAGVPEDGTAVIGVGTHGEDILRRAAGKRKIITFGTVPEKCDVAARFETGTLEGSSFTLTFFNQRKYKVSWQLSGAHQVANAACAAALAVVCGVPEPVIAAGLTKTTLPGMRMKQTEIDGVTYINDAYNANPASMKALLSLMKNSGTGENLVLCLGSMLELGALCCAEHTALLQFVKEAFPSARVITIGREFENIPGNGAYFEKSSDAGVYLSTVVRPGDIVVAKGSRGNQVELALPEAAR